MEWTNCPQCGEGSTVNNQLCSKCQAENAKGRGEEEVKPEDDRRKRR
jgi:hypothetical protein